MFIKKILIIILSLVCISALSYFIYNRAQHEYVINENGFNDKAAINELHEYLMKENPEIKKLYPEQCSKDTVNAIYYDLDDDKTSEIIGFYNCNFYQGTIGTKLFILKKRNDGYNSLTYLIPFYPEYGIKILKHKTNLFHDIEVYAGHIPDNGSSVIPDKTMLLRLTFNGEYYQ